MFKSPHKRANYRKMEDLTLEVLPSPLQTISDIWVSTRVVDNHTVCYL